MRGTEPKGSELRSRLIRINEGRYPPIQQTHIAIALGVGTAVLSHALNDYHYPMAIELRKRIAEYLDSIEHGKKPLPDRRFAKPLVTR